MVPNVTFAAVPFKFAPEPILVTVVLPAGSLRRQWATGQLAQPRAVIGLTAFVGPKPTPLVPPVQELSLKFVVVHVAGVEAMGIRMRT